MKCNSYTIIIKATHNVCGNIKTNYMIIIHQIEKLRKYVNKIKKERLAADLCTCCVTF